MSDFSQVPIPKIYFSSSLIAFLHWDAYLRFITSSIFVSSSINNKAVAPKLPGDFLILHDLLILVLTLIDSTFMKDVCYGRLRNTSTLHEFSGFFGLLNLCVSLFLRFSRRYFTQSGNSPGCIDFELIKFSALPRIIFLETFCGFIFFSIILRWPTCIDLSIFSIMQYFQWDIARSRIFTRFLVSSFFQIL